MLSCLLLRKHRGSEAESLHPSCPAACHRAQQQPVEPHTAARPWDTEDFCCPEPRTHSCCIQRALLLLSPFGFFFNSSLKGTFLNLVFFQKLSPMVREYGVKLWFLSGKHRCGAAAARR